ncbi:MAG: nitroreductase family protein [Eubacteriales bacterium]|nr:nitroreductase family protein [Eubacteriales bacterium]
MTELQAIKERHSVRKYMNKSIEMEIRQELDAFVEKVNTESGLNITIQYDDPEGFDSKMAHYGSFRNVNNYIVLKGDSCPDFEKKCGYYGEKIVIKAQMLGLNTCWAALTFNKKFVKKMIPENEKFSMVIALGYGETQGTAHKGKKYADVVLTDGTEPTWFKEAVEAALLAPTAVNQQKFMFSWKDQKPGMKVKGFGMHTKVDLGIVKYHFEIGAKSAKEKM